MTVLVLGETGQLAQHLRQLLPDAEFWGRRRFDLRQAAGLPAAIERLRPSFIVNAAAFTAVDKAESEHDMAWRLNAEAPAMAARAAAALDIPLVQVSTDYVFDGSKQGEYSIDDACRPINVYGMSKLAGELAVRALSPKTWVLRTSWVFGEHGANFFTTIVRLARTEPVLRVVADQAGRPTYAGHLAALIAGILRTAERGETVPFGTYHAVGGRPATWYAFAEEIVGTARRHGLVVSRAGVQPISTAEYPTAARRPQNSVLAPSVQLLARFDADFDWVSGLDTAVERMAAAAKSLDGRP
jgi:dTDP-4-dehydrorhamnose reductase